MKGRKNFLDTIRKLFAEIIEEHMETYKEGEIRDFVDAYIQQIKESGPESSFHSDEGSENIILNGSTNYTQYFNLFKSNY